MLELSSRLGSLQFVRGRTHRRRRDASCQLMPVPLHCVTSAEVACHAGGRPVRPVAPVFEVPGNGTAWRHGARRVGVVAQVPSRAPVPPAADGLGRGAVVLRRALPSRQGGRPRIRFHLHRLGERRTGGDPDRLTEQSRIGGRTAGASPPSHRRSSGTLCKAEHAGSSSVAPVSRRHGALCHPALRRRGSPAP